MTGLGRGTVAASSDRGDIVLGWLTRVSLVLALLGVVTFDAVAVGVAAVTVQDDAATAARAASAEFSRSPSVQGAYDAAVRAATEAHPGNGIDPASFTVARDATVRLRVHRQADSLLLLRVPWLRDWTNVEGEGLGRAGP